MVTRDRIELPTRGFKRAYSVQVKTNVRTFGFWLIGKQAKETVSATHIYVLVNIRNSARKGEFIEYFVLSSKQLSKAGYHEGNWPNVRYNDLIKLG